MSLSLLGYVIIKGKYTGACILNK